MMLLNYIDPIAFELGLFRFIDVLSSPQYTIRIFYPAQESVKRIVFDKDILIDIIFWSAIFGLSQPESILLFFNGLIHNIQ